MENNSLFDNGGFFTGCNYWASNAGLFMWTEWEPETVERDLRLLRESNLRVLRIFPLWSVFQPITALRGWAGTFREIRRGELPLDDSAEGIAGVDPVMIERFGAFLDLCHKYGFTCIVSLITGWMSGRLLVPPALEGMNLLSDPDAIMWELRFVKYMVTKFKSHPAVAAWELGNETNCLAELHTHQQAYLWSATITNTIRAADPTRPVISGMHSLSPTGVWRMQDQGEILDVLSTHPYPIFVPFCDTDPINEFKSPLHSTAESVYYRGIGGKPCFAEELGTLGPMISSEQIAADYVNCCLYSLWAHDCHGLLWWCAADQSHLTKAPYDWNSVERELGLLRLDGSKKPVLDTLEAFQNRVDKFGTLPPRLVDAVCVVTDNQDQWSAAYGCFLLAKQAGLDVEYAYSRGGSLPDAPVYLLPSLRSDTPLDRHYQYALLEKVAAGATLYLSLDDALLSPFTEMTGLEVQTRSRETFSRRVTLDGSEMDLRAPFRLTVAAKSAQVLARDEEGNPVFAVNRCGKGKIVYLAFPIERMAAETPGILRGENAPPLYKFYEALSARSPEKTAVCADPYVGITEHPFCDGRRALVIINSMPLAKEISVTLKGTWEKITLSESDAGEALTVDSCGFTLKMPANSGSIIILEK